MSFPASDADDDAALARRIIGEYSLEPGGSVDCTVTPDDDLVVAYLHAPLRDVNRLDVLIDDTTIGKLRANDVVFDPKAACGVPDVPALARS